MIVCCEASMRMERMGVWLFTYYDNELDSIYRADKLICDKCNRTVIADVATEPYRTGYEAKDLAAAIIANKEEHYHYRGTPDLSY